MGYFEELNKNFNEYLLQIDNNVVIKQLLGGATESLIGKNIFPMPKDVDANDTSTAYIYVYAGRNDNINGHYKDQYVIVDILCHLNYWTTDDGIRPYLIMAEIDKIFNRKKVGEQQSIDVNRYSKFDPFTVNVKWSGYRLVYWSTNFARSCN